MSFGELKNPEKRPIFMAAAFVAVLCLILIGFNLLDKKEETESVVTKPENQKEIPISTINLARVASEANDMFYSVLGKRYGVHKTSELKEIYSYDTEKTTGMWNPYPSSPIRFSFENSTLDSDTESFIKVTDARNEKNNKKIEVGKVTSVIETGVKDKKILLVNDWSGGAHCCTTILPLTFTKDTYVIGAPLRTADIFLEDTQYFMSGDNLYFIIPDARFAYFDMSYGSSTYMFPKRIFRFDINTSSFDQENTIGKEAYRALIAVYQKEIERIKKVESASTEEILPNLVMKLSYTILENPVQSTVNQALADYQKELGIFYTEESEVEKIYKETVNLLSEDIYTETPALIANKKLVYANTE
jgi:hypothetical protein